MDKCDVAIIGAGPYGLSAAAHLKQLKGLDLRLFGEPMSFWERYMPEQMVLRSPWAGTHIADPENRLTLDVYKRTNGNHHLAYPVPLVDFIKYGHWFHEQTALPADQRKVLRTEPAPNGYQLTLEDGETIHARRVIIAGGIQPFAYRQRMFERLPASLVTHTSELRDFGQFRNKEVLVIGAGQSAVEAAVFLREAGAHAEVLIRNSSLHWLRHDSWKHAKAIAWMFYGSADVGPAGISLLVQRPNWFRRLPRRVQNWWGRRAIRPAVSQRLEGRTRGMLIQTGRFPVQTRVERERLRVRLNDGSERVVDHVVLGTGYRINVALYPFLSAELLTAWSLWTVILDSMRDSRAPFRDCTSWERRQPGVSARLCDLSPALSSFHRRSASGFVRQRNAAVPLRATEVVSHCKSPRTETRAGHTSAGASCCPSRGR